MGTVSPGATYTVVLDRREQSENQPYLLSPTLSLHSCYRGTLLSLWEKLARVLAKKGHGSNLWLLSIRIALFVLSDPPLK
jgi:hypothetical protein